MPPEPHGHDDAADGIRDGAGHRRAEDAPARAGDCDAQAEDRRPARGVDQQEVEHDVDEIDGHAGLHRRSGIARGAQHRAEDDAGRAREHRDIEDEEVRGGERPDGRLDLHERGDDAAHGERDGGEERAHAQHGEHRLHRGTPGALCLARAERPGDKREKADAQRRERAVDEPVDGARRADGGGGAGAQRADHRRIDVLHGGLHELLEHGRPRQRQDDAEHGGIGFSQVHGASLFRLLIVPIVAENVSGRKRRANLGLDSAPPCGI